MDVYPHIINLKINLVHLYYICLSQGSIYRHKVGNIFNLNIYKHR